MKICYYSERFYNRLKFSELSEMWKVNVGTFYIRWHQIDISKPKTPLFYR